MVKLFLIFFLFITSMGLTVAFSVHDPIISSNKNSTGQASINQKAPYEFEIISNYVHEKITLKINSQDKHLKTVKIFDIIGNEVVSLELVHKELYKYDIDFSSFRPGVYLCNLYSDKGIVATRKLLYR